ncbi:MAG TPA: FG-GAP-like repeat-containing protein, partial [Polyangium sp.]|nr:FG-GAP-like repeat-containing protein [Polyangium sp.]
MRRTLLITPLFLLAIACGDEGPTKPPGCGDGELSEDEICDDGNTEDGDGCSADCVPEQGGENCGNGVVDPLEHCDDGNEANGDGCSATCDLESCGNGVVDPGEDCDDGNGINLDGCPNDCTLAKCGNGVIEAPHETCDPPDTAVCDSQCQGLPFCGDGDLEGEEECDDGNFFGGDGCNSACKLEFCGDGFTNDSGQEQCDDGNNEDGDGCSALCVYETCGDGILHTGIGEACDDGNTLGGDGCRSNCTLEVCGDGILDPTEACDDGNAVNNDGCGNDCKSDGCHDGVTNPDERCYTSFSAFPGPPDVTIVGKGDLDGDGRVDVVAWSSENLVWFRNLGDGSLGATPIFSGAPIRAVALGDVDDDGDTDVVMTFGQDMAYELFVWTNDGAGHFTKTQTPDEPSSGITLADLDDDGDADLALMIDVLGGLAVRENMGNGTFGPRKTVSMFPEGYTVVAGDLDGDLDLDLASFASSTSSLRFHQNLGNFTFAAPIEVPIPTGAGSFGANVLLDDVDGDGLLDALTTDALQNEIVIARNQGDFTFALQEVPVGKSASPVLVIDADADGDKDIFLSADIQAGDPQGLSVLTNDGTGTFALGADQWVPEGVWTGPMVTLDLEQDGDEDVVLNTMYGLNALMSNGAQGFAPRQVVVASGSAKSIQLGDVDGDGDDDAVLAGGGVWIAQNDGTGHLLP